MDGMSVFRYPRFAEPRGIITTFPEDGDEQYGLQAREDGPIYYLAGAIWVDYCIRRGFEFREIRMPGIGGVTGALMPPAPTFTLEHLDGTPIDLDAPISSLGDDRWARVRFVLVPAEADAAASDITC